MHSLHFRINGSMWLRSFYDAQHGRRATEKLQSAAGGGRAGGGNMLVVASAGTKKVAQLVVAPAEPGG